MKKFLLLAVCCLLAYLAYLGVALCFLPPVTALKSRKANHTIQVKDWHGGYHSLVVGPKNRYWTPSAAIPAEMKWAVILAEDASFYRHEGIDVKAIKNAIAYDLEKKSFARGASTITQQTAKNLFLSREKTLTRKVKELYLAKRMEQELTKGRIIELYLNVVELGPMVYGIGHGARYYFGKSPRHLSPRECAFLAAMLPGPRVAYNPYKNLNRVLKRSDMILRLLRDNGVLSAAEYRSARAEVPNVGRLQRKVEESIRKEEVFQNLSGAAVPGEVEPTEVLQEEGGQEQEQQPEQEPLEVLPPPEVPAQEVLPPASDGGAATVPP